MTLIAPIPVTDAATSGRRVAVTATVVILIGSALLLFARLGHYPLWDDEAITAMTARGVWRTGDTSAQVDERNLLAYRDGLLIRDLKDRYTPPLQFYVLAPFMGVMGESDFVCRLPFAICGMVTVGILLRWLWRQRPSPWVWGAAVVVILTNAEFFLFSRQCRYYSLAMMLTTAAAYLYFHLDGRRRSTLALSVVLSLLLASQYLNYAAAVGCLVFDYVVWGRKRRKLSGADWMILLLPQFIVGGVVCSIWNPLLRSGEAYGSGHWLSDRIHLLRWNWRDMLASDFAIPLLLLWCPLLYFVRKNPVLLRLPAALVVYLLVLVALVATPVGKTFTAEIRYLAPVLPICMGIAILAIWGIDRLKVRLKVIAVGVSALSLFMQVSPTAIGSVWGSTAWMFARELVHPQAEPYTPAAAWLAAHVSTGQSVLVRPDWMTYPLMFREGNAVYAWQLTDPPKPEYQGFPDIHFEGRVAPDYMIAFGPGREDIEKAQKFLAERGARYQLVETLHVNWQDLYRPDASGGRLSRLNRKRDGRFTAIDVWI